MAFRSIGICIKPGEPQLGSVVTELEKWLRERGLEVVLGTRSAAATNSTGLQFPELSERADLIIVLGGDGTLLAVARGLADHQVPILGVNLGTLGFLSETSLTELYTTLEAVLDGGYRVETRMRIDVAVTRDGESRGRYTALNDAVIAKTALSRMIDLETLTDGVEVTTYHADGVIVSTSTGSTAYSLSAGGPLLLPTFEAILLTPICPHTLTQRPLVLPADCTVELRVRDSRGGEVQLTIDGQVGCDVHEGDCIQVTRSPHPVELVVLPERNRFEVMRTKLRWGER